METRHSIEQEQKSTVQVQTVLAQVHTGDQSVLPGILAKSFVGQSFASPLCPPAVNYMQHCWRRSKRLSAPFPVLEGFTHTHAHTHAHCLYGFLINLTNIAEFLTWSVNPLILLHRHFHHSQSASTAVVGVCIRKVLTVETTEIGDCYQPYSTHDSK